MNDDYDEILTDEIKRLTKQVATDNILILVNIRVCDLMAVVYAIDASIDANINDIDYPLEEYITLMSYFVDVVRIYHPEFVDELFTQETTEDAIKSRMEHG